MATGVRARRSDWHYCSSFSMSPWQYVLSGSFTNPSRAISRALSRFSTLRCSQARREQYVPDNLSKLRSIALITSSKEFAHLRRPHIFILLVLKSSNSIVEAVSQYCQETKWLDVGRSAASHKACTSPTGSLLRAQMSANRSHAFCLSAG